MIISIGKAFDKIKHWFIIKTLQKMGIEGMCLNIVKAMYYKPITNIILNGEKLKASSQDQEQDKGGPLSSPLFHLVLEALTMDIR